MQNITFKATRSSSYKEYEIRTGVEKHYLGIIKVDIETGKHFYAASGVKPSAIEQKFIDIKLKELDREISR